ncbi:YqaJ viral recombinase family protein [Mycolicibacterium fortuitum]|uniref:lambda exonuclease family protein n=1 Tax=Mycolicibacterium fortuitum TaxID=1766 RepID=UPI0022BA51AE|nr:lambda exonuclease family protein [Mycolicibacterium fortuitum]WAY18429.1 YqaJ viral recombinase family protein [Mycolicibacterium fortuitum]
MTLQILPHIEQRSPEWYEQRRGIVTASMVGQLIATRKLGAIDCDCPECGAVADTPCIGKRTPAPIKTLHPARAEYARNQSSSTVIEPASNDTSRDLTMLLVAERITGYTEPTYVSADMERGHEGEILARAIYAEHYAPVTEVGFMLREGDGIRIGFSPDGLVGDKGLLEIKSPRQKTHLRTILLDGVPIEHMAQIQCGLLVSGREWLDFISYNGGMRLWVKRVYPQRAWFDAITKAVRAFEANAAEMQRLYDDRTINMPMTERVVEDFGLVI